MVGRLSGRPAWRDRKGQEVLLKGREELGVSPRVLGGVGRPCWRNRRGRDGREESGVHPGRPGGFGSLPGGPRVVERLSGRTERVWESPQEGQEVYEAHQ